MEDGQTEIHGTCAPGFEPVRRAFAANFAERGEIGASVAVLAAGEPVVSLWAGLGRPGEDPRVAGGPAPQLVVHDEGDDVAVRAPADRRRRT